MKGYLFNDNKPYKESYYKAINDIRSKIEEWPLCQNSCWIKCTVCADGTWW